jgi:Protein of unknown function (DUF2975)
MNNNTMNAKHRLPKFCCRLCAVLEVVISLAVVLLVVLILALPSLSGRAELTLGPIGLVPEAGALVARANDSASTVINIKNLHGTLSLTNPGDSAELRALTRWHTVPMLVGYGVFVVALLDMLRRLFRNVARGESFTDRSVGLVQKIGMTIILFSLLSSTATAWGNRALVTYLKQHAEVQGIKMAFTEPAANTIISMGSGDLRFQIGWGEIMTGLLVLALGEVFRQGLALKTESDLTI